MLDCMPVPYRVSIKSGGEREDMTTSKTSFRLAVVGAGGVGSIHIKNALKNETINLVGVCELDQKQAERSLSGAQVPVVKSLTDLDQHKPEGVIIASTTSSHGKIAQQAIDLKIPFLCEKPLASELSTAKQIADNASAQTVYGAMAFNRRFHERYSQMRTALERGEIGAVETVHVVSRTAHPPSAEFITTSGGLFGEKGSHFYDLLRWMLNTEIQEVFVYGDALFDPEFKAIGQPDTAVISMRLESGALCSFDFSWRSAYGQDERIEIAGSKGMIQGIQTTTGAYQRYGKDGYSRGGTLPGWQMLFEQTYVDEVETFIRDVRSGTDVQMPTLNDGVRAQEVAEAVRVSYETKRPVRLKELGL